LILEKSFSAEGGAKVYTKNRGIREKPGGGGVNSALLDPWVFEGTRTADYFDEVADCIGTEERNLRTKEDVVGYRASIKGVGRSSRLMGGLILLIENMW